MKKFCLLKILQNYCASSDELFLNFMGYKIELVGTEKIDVPSRLILDCPNRIFSKEFDVF